ncbi:hypothetical protein IQ247_13505 [Plectonema cf. radiosum LEGE 06105]|uniref:Uncharacterized protein n=1 Tax=Plectonema cf. radiosum LEGE 06105 TaxID=945769 RepID=A0A8J7F7U8_9CYAN|nr:hypothetical protein [Plectonema radiosum]MBE9213669.1 hypothetical protein [Plectonema cf. radiosum LEGE 06105]
MNRIKNQLQQFQEIGIWYSLACLSSWATAISISIFIISGAALIALPLTGNKTPETLKKANSGSCGFAIGFILLGAGAAAQGDRDTSYTLVRLSRNYEHDKGESGDYLSCQCLGCKYASGDYLLPCAVNPSLQKDEHCSYFEGKSESTSIVDEL